MARLYRPYIPMAVRVRVANAQCHDRCLKEGKWPPPMRNAGERDGAFLKRQLAFLFGDRKSELHHRPALVNRRRYVRGGKVFYDPPANDPEHLVYLADDDHDIETRVRGVGAQRSDLGQRRYQKNVDRNRARKKSTRRNSSGLHKRPAGLKRITEKRKWPPKGSRPFPKRSKR